MLYYLRKIKKAFRKIIYFLNARGDKCLVLLYHRVIDLKKDPQMLSVSIENFEKHLHFLKENFEILTLQEFITNKKIKTNKKKIVITFDDGYFDNYKYALPLLEKYEIPATIFISTGFINKPLNFWWDELEIFFSDKILLPNKLDLEINGVSYFWEELHINKEKCYADLVTLFKTINITQTHELLHQIKTKIGGEQYFREEYRALTEYELIELSKSKFIEIGAHTVNHCVLSKENEDIQKFEICESKYYLEKLLNKKILSFSYPFGSDIHFNETTMSLVKELDFNCGIANIQGLAFQKVNLYKIPRFLVRNWDELELKNQLDFVFKYNVQ